MLIVRGTKKLRDRLRAAPPASDTDTSTTMLGDWFANALFLKPQVALFVNERTMLPVFVALAPAATLLDRATEAIAAVLREHGMPTGLLDSEVAAMAEVKIAPTNSRQIIGVMNEFAFQAEHRPPRTDDDFFSLSMRLSGLILGPLMQRHDTPASELATLFAPDADVIDFPSRVDRAAPREAESDTTYQLKIMLCGVQPPVWRRVIVAGGETLGHLHDVIQAAFGWSDAHLHDFEIDDERYGTPTPADSEPITDEREVTVDQIAAADTIRYTYDFGDNWEHEIIVETTIASDEVTTVPDCIGGRRACPPEDCGGPWGYYELLEILADPNHPEHAERVEWLGRETFDPDAFVPGAFAENLHNQQAFKLHDLFD